MDKRKNFPSKPYQEFLEREKLQMKLLILWQRSIKCQLLNLWQFWRLPKTKG